jgi:hypothetical protein
MSEWVSWVSVSELESLEAWEWTRVATRDDVTHRAEDAIVTLWKRGDEYQVRVTPPSGKTYATYAGVDARRAARAYLTQPLAYGR